MNTSIRFLMLCLLLMLTGSSTSAQLRTDTLPGQGRDAVWLGAHRGDWRMAPENSLAAVQRCMDMGLQIVEIDIRKTKDGQLVVPHDKTLDRTSTGTGKVQEQSLAELKNYFLKDALGVPTQHQIPSLKEVLLLTRGKILVFIDKAEAYIPELTLLLDSLDMHREIILFGRNPTSYQEQAQLFGKLLHQTFFVPVLKNTGKDLSPYIREMNERLRPRWYAFHFPAEDSSVLQYVDLVKGSGAGVWFSMLWSSLCGGHDDELSVKHPDRGWGWALCKGAAVLLTDRPYELKQYLGNHTCP